MRIGLYISPSHAVPPNEKNILAPWILIRQLADGLIDRDHEVVLFAAKDSKTKAKLISGGIESTIKRRTAYTDPDAYKSYVIAQELALMREVIIYAKAGKLDVVHIHQPVERLYPALLAMPARVPIVVTFHDPIVPARFAALEKLIGLGNIHFVSLSRSQQRGVPFPFAGVVPNGVDTKLFRPDSTSSGRAGLRGASTEKDNRPLLITGRIVKEKGFVDAVEAAKLAGKRLMIVGQEYTSKKAAREYFVHEIKPSIDGKFVIWESVAKPDHLIGHYQQSAALLFPIQWEEPFGLVMIEAMACGTPVIAYNHGSVPEIVVDGKTGFIVPPEKGVDGLVTAIKKLHEIDRVECRRHVEKHFALKHMIEGYEKIYRNSMDR